MSPVGAPRWVLLIHQIPPKPDYLRVKVWRRLQRLGAVAIKNSVYALPRSDDAVEDFQWQTREIVAAGGAASVCAASFVDGLTDGEIEDLFREARKADYRDILSDAERLVRLKGGSDASAELARLRRRLADVAAIDFFGAPNRRAAEEALMEIEARVRTPAPAPSPAAPAGRRRAPSGATWVTRRGIYVDRIGSAWLIRRFIDPKARFKFVAPEGYRRRRGEIRFDMFDAEYTHEGEACTFETLVARFGVGDAGVAAIAQMVHDIDCKEARFGRPETSGLERLLRGVASRYPDDTARLERGMVLFDALHAGLAAGGADATRGSAWKRGRSSRR